MNDATDNNSKPVEPIMANDPGEAGPYGDEQETHETAAAPENFLSKFVHQQPLLTLSLAFGLGLLATSFLTRKRT